MSVEVKLELGHRGVLREKCTAEGFTHDWTVFVKGGEGSNIHHFVEKVVFHLHESFPKPKRVVKEPPYQVSESGYAGFTMPIEVYFRSKEEPKKVCFEYDMFLRLEGSPVHNLRLEKLTFQNPSDEFRRKLLKARTDKISISGPVPTSSQSQSVTQTSNSEDQPVQPLYTKSVSIAEKKPRPNTSSKDSVKPSVPSLRASQSHSDSTVVVATKLTSPDPMKYEDSHSNSNPSKKLLHPITNASNKETIVNSNENLADDSKESKIKTVKIEKDQKSGDKRSSGADGQTDNCSSEKKKKHGSSKGHENSARLNTKDKKPKHKSKSVPISNKKDKHKLSNLTHSNSKSPKNNNCRPPSPDSLSNEAVSPRVKNNSQKVSGLSISSSESSPVVPEADYQTSQQINVVDDLNLSMSSDEEMTASYTSKEHIESGVHNVVKNSSQKSKTINQNSPKSKSASRTHRSRYNSKENHESSVPEKKSKPSENQLFNKELVELQRRIMSLDDQKLLQRIVDIIEKTGKFHITTNSFDFDLCSLDYHTVRKLQNYLSI